MVLQDSVPISSLCNVVVGMYCYLLCGLVHRDDVEVLTAVFAYTLVEALRMLEIEWQSLCHDIRSGLLNENRVTDPSLRAAMKSKVLTCRNAHCANQVAAICEEKNRQCAWNGIIKRLWPKCKYVLSIMTGSMEAYMETLQAYAGEESRFSCMSYVLFPQMLKRLLFYTCNNLMKLSILCRIFKSHVSKELERISITFCLYRYVLGDIFCVTGFFHDNPQSAYVCRKNVILSINIDKTSEEDLKLVVRKAASVLRRRHSPMKLVEYSSYANTDNAHEHYVIFWVVQGDETNNSLDNQRLLVECATGGWIRTFSQNGHHKAS
ncbi:hypothetical protein L7F22_062255 [Adiantum nelumboides]|nr:hypothetical protein [Adiantum nelumboides]